jgi:hypothetical protein
MILSIGIWIWYRLGRIRILGSDKDGDYGYCPSESRLRIRLK